MARFPGGPCTVQVQRPARGVLQAQWPVIYPGVDGEAQNAANPIPGQAASDGEYFAQWRILLFHPLSGPLDVRTGDLLTDVSTAGYGPSVDPDTGQATTWVVRGDQGSTLDHITLLCTLQSSKR